MANVRRLTELSMPVELAKEVAAQIEDSSGSGGPITAESVTATAIAPGTATNVQAILAELAARITELEPD